MKERNIALCIVFSIITCGIYGIYWFIMLTNEAVEVSAGKEYNTSGALAFVFTLITCGIYGYYWYYKMGKSLYVANKDKGIESGDNSLIYLILGIFGLGIVSDCLMQSDLNRLAK